MRLRYRLRVCRYKTDYLGVYMMMTPWYWCYRMVKRRLVLAYLMLLIKLGRICGYNQE